MTLGKPDLPSTRLLSSVAHAVGKPSFESLTTEQRLSALNAALLVTMNEMLTAIVADIDSIRVRVGP